MLRRLGAAALAALAAAPLPAQVLRANVAESGVHATSAPPFSRAPSRLESRIDAVLDRPHLRGATWGVEVRDAATGRLLYARNAEQPLIPASNLKLVVAAAAAHHLPPEYRFRTTLYAAGPVVDGVLQGDLVLYGRGDPMISARYFPSRTAVFAALADSLEARGIRRIAGGIVADESWLDAEYVRADWEADDLRWWYAAPVSALGFNDNAIDLTLRPGPRVGTPARVAGYPSTSALEFDNRSTTVASGGRNTLDLERAAPGVARIRVRGQVPVGAGARTESFAVSRPARWTGTVFREVLEREGIDVARDEVRTVSDSTLSVASTARVLVEWRSPALPQAIAPVLLRSQNWFAELLVKTLGKEVAGRGTWDDGLAVEARFLVDEVGLDPAEFVLRDGSGLSDRNRITPRALVRVLDYVRRTPRQSLVRGALPVSGRTGSLEHRLADLPGRVAAKTGYIGGVNALSGYVTMPDGRDVIFSIIANGGGQPSSRMKAGIDDVVRAIAAEAGR